MDDVVHKTSTEASDSVFNALDEALKTDKWMVGVWVAGDDGVRLIRRTTCNFPVGLFDAAVGQLSRELAKETGEENGQPEPLPMAPHLKVHGDTDGFFEGGEKLEALQQKFEEEKEVAIILHGDPSVKEPEGVLNSNNVGDVIDSSVDDSIEAMKFEHASRSMEQLDKKMVDSVSPHVEAEELRPSIIKHGENDCVVCVPDEWIDKQVVDWVEGVNPSGTKGGWFVEMVSMNVPCDSRKGFVHQTLYT